MLMLPQYRSPDESPPPSNSGGGGGCGTSCGAGLEKIYPTTAVRHGAMRWIGEFSYKPGTVFKCGGKVVIQSERGIELGEQVSLTCTGCSNSVSRDQIKEYIKNSGPEFYRLRAGRILREATPQDLDEDKHLNAGVRDDIDKASLIAAQLNLDMKIVTVEHLLGGERIVFYFRSEARIDFRDLVRELARQYQTRIEMRQVGARDEARLVADYEICGRECCCKNFLKKLRPVNMKMAKLQKSTLDPSKVSGRCGRLRCCLRYEHEGYESLERKLPRIGSHVECEYGIAQVVDRQVLTQLVLIRAGDGQLVTIPLEEIKAQNVVPPPPAPEREGRPGRYDGGDRGPRMRPPHRAPPEPRPPQPPREPVPSQFEAEPEVGNDAPDPERAEPLDANRPPDQPDSSPDAQQGDAGPSENRPRRKRRRRRPGRPRPDGGPSGDTGPSGPAAS